MLGSHKPLGRQTIVITGASSGIGRATALAAARRQARVVLVSRNEAALDEVAREISSLGGESLVAAADVADRSAVDAVADAAVAKFGAIDTWVNDAGVSLYGRLDENTEAEQRALFDTNLWGVVNGSLAAARHMAVNGGAIINLGSIASDFAFPLQGMYCASKHAIKGFTDALRVELMASAPDISVTLIKPASIASPLVEQVANRTSREPKLPPPLYAPEEVANAILHAAVQPRRDINVGGAGVLLSFVAVHFPHLTDVLSQRFGAAAEQGGPMQNRRGNLFEAGRDRAVASSADKGRRSGYTRAVLSTPSLGSTLARIAVAALSTAGGGDTRGPVARTRRPMPDQGQATLNQRDEDKADAIDAVSKALDTIEEVGHGLDAWQRHYLQQAFEHLAAGRYGEAITFAEDAITPVQERNGASVPDATRQMAIGDMRRDLDGLKASGAR